MKAFRWLSILAGLALVPAAEAQTYPDKPIKVVNGFGAGGGTDLLLRTILPKLGEILGQQLIIDYRPAAGGNLAMDIVAKAPPDGYTLLMGSPGLATNPFLYRDLGWDAKKDFAPISLLGTVQNVLVVNPALPVHSVADLVKLAKEKPLTFGSGGAGAFHHLMGELFKTEMGIPMTHVPYKGTLPALNDVIAGHIDLMFSDLAPAYSLIQAGKVRALGVTTAQRAASAPEIPTLAEVGVPGFDWAAWQAVAVPGATPKEIIAKLNSAVNAATAQPDVEKQLVSLQFIPVGKKSPEELERFVRSETARWAKVLQQAGVAGSE